MQLEAAAVCDSGRTLSQDSGGGCSVRGRFLGQDEKCFSDFSQVEHKGTVLSRFHHQPCAKVSLFTVVWVRRDSQEC